MVTFVVGALGFGAKVATCPAEREDGSRSGRTRLIAVYTRDSADREDVGRVLRGLVELGLVTVGGRPIWYKCDAYTHLEVMGKNPYGLKVCLCSSLDVFKG